MGSRSEMEKYLFEEGDLCSGRRFDMGDESLLEAYPGVIAVDFVSIYDGSGREGIRRCLDFVWPTAFGVLYGVFCADIYMSHHPELDLLSCLATGSIYSYIGAVGASLGQTFWDRMDD